MRAIEHAIIASGATTGRALMEQAGQGAAAAIRAAVTVPGVRRAVVLCGPGNNGGDGFVVARLLARAGWEVSVFLYGDPARLPPDARHNHDLWQAMGPVCSLGFPELTTEGLASLAAALAPGGAQVVVDALFGIGLGRPLDRLRPLLALLRDGHDRPALTVALDLPSGLDADSGAVVGGDPALVIAADLTVTFHVAKPGHLAGAGPALCGRLVVVDIGLPAAAN